MKSPVVAIASLLMMILPSSFAEAITFGDCICNSNIGYGAEVFSALAQDSIMIYDGGIGYSSAAASTTTINFAGGNPYGVNAGAADLSNGNLAMKGSGMSDGSVAFSDTVYLSGPPDTPTAQSLLNGPFYKVTVDMSWDGISTTSDFGATAILITYAPGSYCAQQLNETGSWATGLSCTVFVPTTNANDPTYSPNFLITAWLGACNECTVSPLVYTLGPSVYPYNQSDPLVLTLGPDVTYTSASGVFLTQQATSVPEPSTFILLGAGLAGLGAWRRSMLKRI